MPSFGDYGLIIRLLFSLRNVIFLYTTAINVVVIFLFAYDKMQARRGKWRVSESTLLLVSLAGGSPGALFATCIFNHKQRKQSFMNQLHFVISIQVVIMAYLLVNVVKVTLS